MKNTKITVTAKRDKDGNLLVKNNFDSLQSAKDLVVALESTAQELRNAIANYMEDPFVRDDKKINPTMWQVLQSNKNEP